MVFVVSFGFFLAFVSCLALSLMMRRGSLKSEKEAHAILEGVSCAACSNTSCGFNGNSHHKPSKHCLQDMPIAHKQI